MKHEEIIALAKEEGLTFVPEANSPLARIVMKAIAREREACAKVADGERYVETINDYKDGYDRACRNIARAIHARGSKEAK